MQCTNVHHDVFMTHTIDLGIGNRTSDEAWFVSAAHGQAEVDATLAAARKAFLA